MPNNEGLHPADLQVRDDTPEGSIPGGSKCSSLGFVEFDNIVGQGYFLLRQEQGLMPCSQPQVPKVTPSQTVVACILCR